MADLDLTAAIEEASAALSHRGMWIGPRKARLFLEAALPEIRKALAQQIHELAEKGLIFTGSGHEVELLKAASYARAKALGDAAAIVRGEQT